MSTEGACPLCRRTPEHPNAPCGDCLALWRSECMDERPELEAAEWGARRAWEFADAATEQLRSPARRTVPGDPGPSRFARRRGVKR